MNLALFMLTFMLSGLYATESYSQTVRISLNMKNSTVKEVLKKIENCSEFTFFYNDEIIDVDKRVTLNAEDLSISDILTTILPNCSYTISNKNIIITVKEAGVHQHVFKSYFFRILQLIQSYKLWRLHRCHPNHH